MSVIAAYYYNEGRRIREVAIDERIELDKNRSGFCWIGLSEPSESELRALQATYNLHPLAIDNAMHPMCPPKLEVYNGELYVVAQTAELVGDRIRYGKTAIFTGHNHLITVRHGNAGALGNLREQLEGSPAQFGKGVDYVLHAILHRIVDQYLPIFEMIEDDVLAMLETPTDLDFDARLGDGRDVRGAVALVGTTGWRVVLAEPAGIGAAGPAVTAPCSDRS